MKKSAEIKGLPIISIMDGIEIGRVKSLVINPDQGSVDFFTVEHEEWQYSGKAIPFRKVVGIGEYALTVENENAVIDLNEIPIANDLFNKKTKIENTRLMTRKGQLIGEAKEYYIDEQSGKIVSIEVQMKEEKVLLETEYVVTYGKDIIIVAEQATEHLVGTNITEMEKDFNKSLEEIERKQDQLLVGKTVVKDIQDRHGEIIIAKDAVLTEESVRKARLAGPEIFIELSMNIIE
ncbi:uncharacterized protein YrrD [Oikeobacillus pervagus]|uniref:Uncharacterized protein YrrD n=1 Tax=Oikeobacillus pervagus TaxID=1325931 RepID=A0AAJ1T0F8_9BACI|nr:PRC-barrel domain-containing protein [Oikeobacillus pervagus]MDQ0214537.1 uncharacterized protein YrrD [Oikeobacillus pervagus]